MYILGEDVPDVIFYCEEASAVCIVPGEIDACIFISFPIDCDGVVLLEHQSEVIGVALSMYLTPKPSTIRLNRMGHHLWRQRPGVVVVS